MSKKMDQFLPEEGRKALQFIAEGIHLLALLDLQYRLSLQRQAFIKPVLNFLGKNTADSAPIDEWLFGREDQENQNLRKDCEGVEL